MRRNHIALALAVLIVLPGIFIKTTAQNNGLHRPFAVQPLPTATRTLTHTVSTADQLMFGGVATTILVDDPTTVTDHTPERTVKRLRAYVYFHAGGDRETYTYGKAEWSATVRGSLIGIDADDVEHEIETGIAIDIDQAHPEAVFVLPESHQYLQPTNHPLHPAAGVDKYKKIIFRINGDLADDAQDGFTCTPVGIDPYLRLSLRIDEEIVYEELASIPTNERLLSNVLYASPIEQNPGNCDPVFVGDRRMLQVVGSEVTLTWNLPYTITDARYNTYEVELIRLYNIERSKATNRHLITAKIDWTTAERFVVKGIECQLRFSPVHGSGYYAFRVRPITTLDDGSYNNPTNYGPWSSAPNDGATIELAPCNNEWSQITDGDGIFELQRHVACFFFEDIDETKVWAASRTIASDQGRSSLIGENKAYLDAFGRVVQMLDRDRSSDVTVGSQVVYDLDGRPSLQTLATPLLDDQGMRIDQLRYRPEAITHNSALYTVDAYDRLSGTNMTYHAPNTVDDASAIGQYYSDDNPDLFIAGSGGYPFTRTLYTSDGRPRSMILAGADRRPGASASQDGRSTRTLVGSVGPHELVPFFGIEAPLGSELKKVITISPDNVSSVQYLNKRGQVILSAIVQQISGENERISYDGEDALANLNGKLPNDAASLDDPNSEKIVTLWGQNLEATGGTAVSEDTLKSSIRFTMSSAESRTMNFLRDAMSGVYLSSECFTLCIPCNRSILGRIIRVDVVPSQQIWPSSGYAQVINFPFENCSTGTASTASNISTTNLEPGEYILERIVVAKGLNATGETPEQTAQAMILPDAQVASALQKVFNDAFGVGHQLLTPKQQLEQYSVNRANPSLNPLYTLPARIGTSGPCFNVPLPERKLCDVCPPGGDPAVGVRYAEYAIATYTSIVGSAPGDLNDVIFYLDQNGAKQDKLGSDADPAVPPTAEQQIARLNDMIQAMLESECQIYEEKCRYFWSVWSSLLKARCEAIRENPASPELQPLQTDIVEAFLDIVGRCYPATCTTAACKDDIIATKLTIDEGEEVAAYARIRTAASTQQIDDCIERHTDPNTSTVDWQGVSICLSSNINDVDRRKLEASSGTRLPEDVNDLLGTEKLRDQALGDLQHRCRKNCEGLTPEILRQLRNEYPSDSDAKLWCRLQSVIDDCMDHCDVTEESSPAEITRFKQQLFGGVLVRQSLESPPGPCPTGFTTVSTQQNLVDALVAYLNHHYDKLRDTATRNYCVNYAAVIYNYLYLNNFQAHIPICIDSAAAKSGQPVGGLYPEIAGTGDCGEYEATGQTRFMLRVLPGVEGRFYRPVGNDSCVWCAIDFEGPTFSTQVVHPWITTLNSMLNSLWGYELDARTPSASTEHLIEAGQTPERWYEHAVPEFLTPNQDFETALLTWVATLNNTSAFVNGSPVNWPAFASGYLGNFVIAPLPVVPVSGLFSFGTQAWRASENGTMSQVPWRAFGSFAIQFGIPSWVRRSIKNSTLGYLSWRLVPSVLSSGTPAEIGEIALNGSVAGQDYVRKYTATEPGDEYRDLAASPFTTKIGLFEQDPQRRLLFRDLLRGTTVTFDQVRFYAIQTRRLLGPLNGPADSCIITGLCSLSVSCPVCVKWDTISTDIYDQIDVVKPTPCDQRELERIKAEITRLFYERVNAIQQDINTQIREKCSAKNISAKYGIYLGEKLHHVTLYYYDRAGRLVRTVSPKGVDGDNLSTEDPSHIFVSRFHTDSRGRLLTKTVPDGGTERYYYDKYGRLRFIIDAVQWADDPQRMTYLKYDNLDRLVETGEVRGVTDLTGTINTYANDMSWPGTSLARRDVARYHYDAKASTSIVSGWAAVSTEHPTFTQRNTRLRLSWADAIPVWTQNETDVDDLANVVRTFFSYDPHGNVTSVVNDIPVNELPDNNGLSARLIKKTDYTHDLSTGNITAVDFQKVQADDFLHKYKYDASGRLKIVETSRNDVLWDRDVVYDYNLDGSLKRETIGEDSVQGRDYTYTLLGQIKGINHPTLNPDKDPGGDGATSGVHSNVGKDAFGMSFHYHDSDYLRSYNTTPSVFNDVDDAMLGVPDPAGADPYNLYSGLVGAWAYKTQETGDADIVRDGELLGERFRYDKIGRLRTDTTYLFNGTNWVSDGDGGWSTRFVYDQNSNLIHVKRWGMEDGSTSTALDNSTLIMQNVTGGSNVIESIDDAVTNTNAYADGTDDLLANSSIVDGKGRVSETSIGSIDELTEYNSRDQIVYHQKATLSVKTLRDAFDRVVREDVFTLAQNPATLTESYWFVPDLHLSDLARYHREGINGEIKVSEWRIGIDRLGVSRQTDDLIEGNVYTRTVGQKLYELTDHLGTIRSLVSDVLTTNGTQAEQLSIHDHDPYGGARLNRNSSSSYAYRFQSMRLESGFGSTSEYLTEYRLYDVRTSSWQGIDLVVQPQFSPYQGLASSPVNFIDSDGNLVIFANGFRMKGLNWYQSGVRINGWHHIPLRSELTVSGVVGNVVFAQLASSNPPNMVELWQVSRAPVYKTDVFDYWAEFDDQFMDKIGDENAVYVDGSSAPGSSAQERYLPGRTAGKQLIEHIRSGRIPLRKNEVITGVDHSQGDAYLQGVIDELCEAGYQVDAVYSFAPKQAGDIQTNPGVRRSVQVYSPIDQIAPFSPKPKNSSTEFTNVPIPNEHLPRRGFKQPPSPIYFDPSTNYGAHTINNYYWYFNYTGLGAIVPVNQVPVTPSQPQQELSNPIIPKK